MLHCVFRSGENSCDDMTALERQRRRMTWQPQQEEEQEHHRSQSFYGEIGNGFGFGLEAEGEAHDSALAEVVAKSSMKPDPPPQSGWATMGFGSCAVSATSTSTHTVSVSPTSSPTAQHTFRKRKSDKLLNSKVVAENEKKMKGSSGEEGESKMREENRTKNTTRSTNNKRDSGGGSSKENSNQKQEYIHVRARRGQATDSHSLAERVRREKISERMKYLQDLVPGCNKITGKAGMLDEIINYVQSLQRQVEFLSMKLAAVNPRLDFNLDDLFSKQVFGACGPSFPTIGMGSDMNNLECLQFNTAQQIVSCCGLDMGVTTTPTDMGLRRSFSAPVSIPETFLDSCCFTQILPSFTWESDFHNLSNVGFDQARGATSFPSQPFTGLVEAINPKMEM